MNQGKARLWTGIGCVGTLVTTSVALLAFGVPHAIFPVGRVSSAEEYSTLLGFFTAAAAVILPFDLMGGLLIPAVFETKSHRSGIRIRQWCRGVGIQLLFFSLTFFFYLQIGREVGAFSLVFLFGILQVNLLAGQELVWRAMTSNSTGNVTGGTTLFLRNTDQRFVGGITGLPGCDSILIPDAWRTWLRPSHLTLLVERRKAAIRSGGRLRGILLAMVWNVVSFALAILAGGAAMSSVADLITVYLWFLLFSFAGLLILPTFNRRSVFALDRRVADAYNAEELQRAVAELDLLTDQDPERSASAESVFQPIPCPDRRSQALANDVSIRGSAWNVARTALFLSWAFGGPLARAVHCNVGRPELWAILPTD